MTILLWGAAGLSLGFSFHSPYGARSVICAWVFMLIIAYLYRQKTAASYWHPLFFGVILYFTAIPWLPKVIAHYADINILIAFFLALLVISISALQFPAMHFLVTRLDVKFLKHSRLALPLGWFVAEELFPQFFPWSLANTQVPFSVLVQGADIFGSSAVSALLLWWISLFLELLFCLRNKQANRFGLCYAFLLCITTSLILVYGTQRIDSIKRQITSAAKVAVALVQADLDPEHDFNPEKVPEIIAKHRKLSEQVVSQSKVDLLIWPESSVPVDYFDDEDAIPLSSDRNPYPGLGTPLIFGGQSRIRKPQGEQLEYYNAAYLFLPSGKINQKYFKQLLFPFSEKIPLSGLFPSLNNLFNKSFLLRAGKDQEPLKLQLRREEQSLELAIALAICYEDLEPSVFRELVANGRANMLLTLSNDNWFLETAAAEQHSFLSMLRAVENRRYLVRSTGDGLTTVINPLGETEQKLAMFEQGVLLTEVAVLDKHLSVYSSIGAKVSFWFALLIIVLVFVSFGKRR